jgi:lysozyme
MRVNSAGYALIKQSEGLRLTAYKDVVGVWTIGYGHTSAAGMPIVKPKMSITRQEADAILKRDVDTFAAGVQSLIRVKLNDNQFSGVVSLAFNIGLGAFGKSSVLKAINNNQFQNVPALMKRFNRAGNTVLPALLTRRAKEAQLFMKPDRSAVALVAAGGGGLGFLGTISASSQEAQDTIWGISPITDTIAGISEHMAGLVAGGVALFLVGCLAAGIYKWARS